MLNHRRAPLRQAIHQKRLAQRQCCYGPVLRHPSLNCKQTSILTQLRTDHVPLNGHLFRIKKAATLFCPYCPNITESTNHYLFSCHKYARHRHKLIITLKCKAFTKSFILTDKTAIRHMINYINDTGRFKQFLGDIKAELIEDSKRD